MTMNHEQDAGSDRPWEVRPRATKGDPAPELIWTQVGRALSHWETAEMFSANLFDALVASQPSNYAAYHAFITVKTGSVRTELLEAAFRKAIPHADPAHVDAEQIIIRLLRFGARRNEIAHGRVYKMSEGGFIFGPNVIMGHKWKAGVAKYQYAAADISYYGDCFESLGEGIRKLTLALMERNIAASSTPRTISGANPDDT
jgi:hypothetical protein